MKIKRLLLALAVALSLSTLLDAQSLLPTRPGDPLAWGTFSSCMGALERFVGPRLPDWVVHSTSLSYSARKPLYDDLGHPLLDDRGEQRTVLVHQSGRVFFPPAWRMRERTAMPIVVYNHGTSLAKDAVASEFAGHEWIFGAAAAAYYGFAVAMPDLPGMGGDGTSYHPYCHGKSLGYSVVDALPAVEEHFAQDPYAARNHYVWDGRVYIMGYSEGAYASLAAVKEMETHKEAFGGQGAFMLAGSACMAGPFDVSGATRRRLLDKEEPYDHPFFLPYLILGYHAVYGNLVNPLEAFAPSLIATGETGNILEWANGATDGLVVDRRIAGRVGAAPGNVLLRTLLDPAWVARERLDDPAFEDSPLRGILMENDLAPGWTPTRPILFGQSPDDEDVPLENALGTLRILAEAMRRDGRDPEGTLHFHPLGAPGSGITHIQGLFLALPEAFDWIYRSAFPDLEVPDRDPWAENALATPGSPFE